MTDQELLQAIGMIVEQKTAQIIESKLNEYKTETREFLLQTMQTTKKELLDGVNVLMDTQFQTQFNLLAERQEDILRKMPSQDDMDIIDGTLQEHESEIRVLRQDVNTLKKAL